MRRLTFLNGHSENVRLHAVYCGGTETLRCGTAQPLTDDVAARLTSVYSSASIKTESLALSDQPAF
jgi:hypothetical protein